MNGFDRQAAEQAIGALNLARSNGELAARWLALWQGNALPPREAFRPANFKAFLPTVVLLNVVPGESVIVRLAGTRYMHILGHDVTGMDWIAAASSAHRATRLDVYSRVARGAILYSHRRLRLTEGEDYICEEIVLPFAPDAQGVVPVLAHANVPMDRYLKIKAIAQTMGEPEDFKLVPLVPAARDATTEASKVA